MTIIYHNKEPDGTMLIQGSDHWYKLRRGILTASEMKLIITAKKLEYAENDDSRSHLDELAAQRTTDYTEPTYIGKDMIRGQEDESRARETYDEEYEPVTEVGFITNDKWGFTIGYSPDGLVGDDGQIECKSACQYIQFNTIKKKAIPDKHILQVQTGLLVSGRKWCDFISYSGGMPMITLRIYPDEKMQAAIVIAATKFEEKLRESLKQYNDVLADPANRLVKTERPEGGMLACL